MKHDGRSKGFGFIVFGEIEAAWAVCGQKEIEIDGNRCGVKLVHSLIISSF